MTRRELGQLVGGVLGATAVPGVGVGLAPPPSGVAAWRQQFPALEHSPTSTAPRASGCLYTTEGEIDRLAIGLERVAFP